MTSSWTPGKKQESTVRHLQALYSVVAGGSLFRAVEVVVPIGGKIRYDLLPLFVVFLVTVIPFFHGALRHMDDAYLDESSPAPRNGALFADFALLCIEGCLLLALATSVGTPKRFLGIWITLLGLDACWAVGTHLVFSTEAGRRLSTLRGLLTARANLVSAHLEWAAINVCASLAVAIYVAGTAVLDVFDRDDFTVVFILVLGVARTAIDYVTSWSFYFPPVDASDHPGLREESIVPASPLPHTELK